MWLCDRRGFGVVIVLCVTATCATSRRPVTCDLLHLILFPFPSSLKATWSLIGITMCPGVKE